MAGYDGTSVPAPPGSAMAVLSGGGGRRGTRISREDNDNQPVKMTPLERDPLEEEMAALLGTLGLPHVAARSAWKTNAGWQPRYLALRAMADKRKKRAVLAAIPAEVSAS